MQILIYLTIFGGIWNR